MDDPSAPAPYYRGTRFDRTGVVTDLVCGAHSYVSQWFRNYDPYMHDAVSGPSEEFLPVFLSPVETLKIGVGVLRQDEKPYDRFRLYDIKDKGSLSIETASDKASFRHSINGIYDYRKTVRISESGELQISHELCNELPHTLETYVYCHNFFILDGARTGRATSFEFPFRPAGSWRSDYDSVRLSGNGIEFARDLGPNETVFMGNLKPSPGSGIFRSFVLSNLENGLEVCSEWDRDAEYAVFWSNSEVSCIEPYIPLKIATGETRSWTLTFRFG